MLPGMGGRAFHRKQRRFRNIAILVGLLVSSLMAAAFYYLNNQMTK